MLVCLLDVERIFGPNHPERTHIQAKQIQTSCSCQLICLIIYDLASESHVSEFFCVCFFFNDSIVFVLNFSRTGDSHLIQPFSELL
jgi:hypothetical protein